VATTEVRPQDSATSFTDPIAALRVALRGHYEIERQIGQGAYATVYLARDLKHERKVAIKVLNADPTSETGEIRFIREIRLVARLQHPNILPLHDSGHVEALLYYVMPFVEGETLRIRMHREREMAVDASCSIARETADALAYAHKQGIVHRDIKPENILLSGGHAIVADFGIARAIDVGGVKQLTMTGVAGPGTPAYMSPEQLLGDRPVDARSDIYSLGCVLYEMLAARAPFPGKDGFVKRFTEPPPHISSLRRNVPGWIDAVVAKALAKDPDDRFATATDFVAALGQPTQAVRTSGRHTPIKHALVSPPMFDSDPLEEQELAAAFPDSYPSRDRKARLRSLVPTALSRSQRWLAAARAHPVRSGLGGLGVVAVIAALGAASKVGSLPTMFGGAPPIDSTRFVVLGSMGASPGALSIGSQVVDSLYDAFTKWEGAPVVPESRVAQAIADGAPRPTTEAAAISLARGVGAGRAVWVKASGTKESPRIRIYLYDVNRADNVDEIGVPVSGRGQEYYATAAQRLLGFGDRPTAAIGCDDHTRSFRAWEACNLGHVAFAKWDIPGAQRSFSAAINADPNYAPARVWLAHLLLWTRPDSIDWRTHAVRAAQGLRALEPRDSSLAVAVAALASGDFPLACDTYSKLTAADPRSFVGWYGVGECRRLDDAVIRDTRSKTGWSFRSGKHTALRMYRRALELEPRAHLLLTFDKIEKLLPMSSNSLRIGYAPDSAVFAAFPSLQNDTLSFLPYPIGDFAALPVGANLTHQAALEESSKQLLSFTTEWTRQFPSSPDAYEALADVLEARGAVTDGLSPDQTALGAVLRSRSLTDDEDQKLRLSVREARLRLKRFELGRAGAIADSLLTNHRKLGPNDAGELIGLAAMTGRVSRMAQLARQGGFSVHVTSVSIAPPLLAAASDVFAHAVLGVCGDDVSNLLAGLDRQLQSYVSETHRPEIRRALKTRSLSMLVPCTGGKSALEIEPPYDRLYRMQVAFARKDYRTVRLTFDSLALMRRGSRPGDLTMDYTYQESWLKAALGDTAGAIQQLDLALRALPTLSGNSLKDPGVAGAVGRAMALRADLANGQNDFRTARQWATAVTALWNKADRPLQATVARMRLLAADHQM
jgi:serine/threonine protein kinase/tetratricopeptide (TPR) repeat protein